MKIAKRLLEQGSGFPLEFFFGYSLSPALFFCFFWVVGDVKRAFGKGRGGFAVFS